ncbi:MAG: hypothetical protein HGA45_12230 [Chloroflexales bacterium]|nr:hypothetical protein [Chloroflexales bacterium]
MTALLSTQYALLALALLFLAAQHCRDGPTPAACVSVPIAVGLCYDNVVLALGGALIAEPLLLALNWPRFLLQALIAPRFLTQLHRLVPARRGLWAVRALCPAAGLDGFGDADRVRGVRRSRTR